MQNTDQSPAVLMQFAKWPQAGRVKTRLIPALGIEGALQAHITLSLEVLDNLCATGYDVSFWWDRPLDQPPEEAAPLLANIEAAKLPQSFQQGGDLGERMARALGQGIASHHRAVVIGSDCPSVDPGYVRSAVAALEHYDVVLGPSDDGGYVLIGARRLAPGALEGIAWGTPEVMQQTLQRMEAAGLSVYLLEPRWDVDEPEDWQRFRRMVGER
ncbi:TIGR04282 family arsenosugar biosynthesis glycosyltransferase [Marinobacter sp. NSM]|uniref:TIGR04282 family arsenosugar biosynthesis glycosyltransferase n=1 Tax=Marinobacter sp. NSM TaxID=3458004 RepID=UPI0040350AF4